MICLHLWCLSSLIYRRLFSFHLFSHSLVFLFPPSISISCPHPHYLLNAFNLHSLFVFWKNALYYSECFKFTQIHHLCLTFVTFFFSFCTIFFFLSSIWVSICSFHPLLLTLALCSTPVLSIPPERMPRWPSNHSHHIWHPHALNTHGALVSTAWDYKSGFGLLNPRLD